MEKIEFDTDLGMDRAYNFLFYTRPEDKEKLQDHKWDKVHVTLSPVQSHEPVKEPTIVCLCGSTRFLDTYKKASLEETMDGKIVLSIGCDMRTDKFFVGMSEIAEKKIKDQLDELHLRKIDLADEVLILNVNGYIGESTLHEIAYAKKQGKRIRYLLYDLKIGKVVAKGGKR